jgi:hypothetical protein
MPASAVSGRGIYLGVSQEHYHLDDLGGTQW